MLNIGKVKPVGERLLTTEEVAAYLRVSRCTVWRWCQEKRLPAFKIGREWRISQDRLDELTAERMRMIRAQEEDDVQQALTAP